MGVAIVDHRSIELWRVKKRDWILESFFFLFFNEIFRPFVRNEKDRSEGEMKLSDEQASSSITANTDIFFFFRESFITDEFIRALLWNILSKGSNEEIKRISPSLSKYYRFDTYIGINIPLETTIISMMLAKYRKFRN